MPASQQSFLSRLLSAITTHHIRLQSTTTFTPRSTGSRWCRSNDECKPHLYFGRNSHCGTRERFSTQQSDPPSRHSEGEANPLVPSTWYRWILLRGHIWVLAHVRLVLVLRRTKSKSRKLKQGQEANLIYTVYISTSDPSQIIPSLVIEHPSKAENISSFRPILPGAALDNPIADYTRPLPQDYILDAFLPIHITAGYSPTLIPVFAAPNPDYQHRNFINKPAIRTAKPDTHL